MDMNNVKEEIKKNFQFFSKQTFNIDDFGKFAIIHNAKIICILDTRRDALKMAHDKYKDEIYSIQQINPEKKEFGFLSHALRTT